MSAPEKPAPNLGAAFLVLLIIFAVGLAAMNSNSPERQAARRLREAEERAQISCQRAGCPTDCYNAGMCDR